MGQQPGKRITRSHPVEPRWALGRETLRTQWKWGRGAGTDRLGTGGWTCALSLWIQRHLLTWAPHYCSVRATDNRGPRHLSRIQTVWIIQMFFVRVFFKFRSNTYLPVKPSLSGPEAAKTICTSLCVCLCFAAEILVCFSIGCWLRPH